MPNYSVTVTAIYVGSAEVEAETPGAAKTLVTKGLVDGTVHPDLSFSNYQSVDEPEEIEEDEPDCGSS